MLHLIAHLFDEGKGENMIGWILGRKIIRIAEKLPSHKAVCDREERRCGELWSTEEGHHFKCVTLGFGIFHNLAYLSVFLVIIYIC